MSHYKLITDLPKLTEFVEWLPELEDSEIYYVELFCRRKYDPNMPSSKTYNLMRKTAKKKNLINIIQRFEVPLGSYYLKDTPVSQESLALYININPRCMKKATFSLMRDLVTKVEQGGRYSPESLAMTNIHKSKAKSRFVMFDIDEVKKEEIPGIIDRTAEIVDREAISTVETNSGCHVLVKLEKVTTSGNWFQKIKKELDADQCADIMTPVPGCYQGGFTPVLRLE